MVETYVKVDCDPGSGDVYVIVQTETDTIDCIRFPETPKGLKAAEIRAERIARKYGCDWGTNY